MVVREYHERKGRVRRKEKKAKKEKERTGGVPKWSGAWGVVPIRDFGENGEGAGGLVSH
jgi:hypothetical protein